MARRMIAAAAIAVLFSSCSNLYETSDFMSARTEAAKKAEAAALEAGAPVDPLAPAADAAEATAEGAATAPPGTPTATAESAPPAVPTAEAAAPAPTLEVASLAAPPPPQGLLAMFRSAMVETPEEEVGVTAVQPNADGAPAASALPVAPDPEASLKPPIPVEDQPPEGEISEAELAEEVEADPDKIAIPEEPIDDGLAHDFVNVYTSRPDKPVEMIEGLPGVEWPNGIVLVSRTPDGEPGGLFDGEDHPFARTVPGIPRQVIQAANGLLVQHSAINVGCIKPNLLTLVRRAESHFGHKVVVTSGYRSPAHNRRVKGATHSQHMFCNALDLFMPGVARDDLARFLFAQPDRGGIGLYCHTRSIHIDTGKRRQWRWACKGRG